MKKKQQNGLAISKNKELLQFQQMQTMEKELKNVFKQ